jgi:hypothetical protein
MCRAFADAVAAHGEVAPGRVDATALAEKISRPFVVSEIDDGVEADEEGEGQAAVLGPLRVGAPGGFVGGASDYCRPERGGVGRVGGRRPGRRLL